MIREKCCGAVVYNMKYGEPLFLVELMDLGHTSLPKGHVEGNETEEETAIREIREETGLEVKLDTVFREAVYYPLRDGSGDKEVVFFVAEALPGTMKRQESEIASLEWMPFDRAIEALTYEEVREVLAHAYVYLSITRHFHIEPGEISRRDYCNGLWYREHAVDIHSHAIVGVDDGAQSMKEAMELLQLDWEEGVRTVFATPHYGEENGWAPTSNDVWFGFNMLKEAARKAVPGMEVCFGNEWYCSEDIVDRIRRSEAWPLMPTDWYMVEFLEWGEMTEPADVMLRRLKKMRDSGINTILAHPERYTAIQKDWDVAKRICDLGVLLQVNAYDLSLNKNEQTRNLAQWMAQEELISFIGSDMHGTRIKPDGKPARRPQMKEGIRWLYEHVNDEYANDIVRRNAERLLEIRKLPVVYVPENTGILPERKK